MALPRFLVCSLSCALASSSLLAWRSPLPNATIILADQAALGTTLTPLAVFDPAGALPAPTFSLVSVAPPSGATLFAVVGTMLQTAGAPPAGGTFSLLLRAGGWAGLPDAAVTVVVRPSYLLPPCATPRAAWAPTAPGDALSALTSPAPAYAISALPLPDVAAAPGFNPPGSPFCYVALRQFASSNWDDHNNRCGQFIDGGHIATVGMESEADFVATAQCGLGVGATAFPGGAVGVAIGLESWRTGLTMGGVRDARGFLPWNWQWYRHGRDASFLRGPAGAAYWAPGHPISTTAAYVMQWTGTNAQGQFASYTWSSAASLLIPCCAYRASLLPVAASPPRLRAGAPPSAPP